MTRQQHIPTGNNPKLPNSQSKLKPIFKDNTSTTGESMIISGKTTYKDTAGEYVQTPTRNENIARHKNMTQDTHNHKIQDTTNKRIMKNVNSNIPPKESEIYNKITIIAIENNRKNLEEMIDQDKNLNEKWKNQKSSKY